MNKKTPKLTPVQELSQRLQTLMSKRLAAHKAGASLALMNQIDDMIELTQLDLYSESELENYRNSKDNDGESFIV